MMKKIIAVFLSLAMVLCMASAMAEFSDKVTIGTVSINGAFTLQCGLPEGYVPTPGTVTAEQVTAVIQSEDPNAPIMQLSVAYDEKYYDVDRMNDLSAEELAQLEETYIEDDPGVEISYGETGYGTLLLIARHETEEMDYIAFFSIYKGYCVEFVLVPSPQAEDKNLTEDQLRISVDFLTDLDFIPADAAVSSRLSVANQTFLANLTDYDAEANTVQVAIMSSILLAPATVDALAVGDTLNIGQESIVVETLEKDEYGVYINGEISLDYRDDGVHAYLYDHEYRETVATLTQTIPDTLVFQDHIDPATGDPLDEPTVHTAAEFAAMLAEGGYPDFASDNVYICFDANGELELVDRYYTPWQ